LQLVANLLENFAVRASVVVHALALEADFEDARLAIVHRLR
jgi:hypothetical protein